MSRAWAVKSAPRAATAPKARVETCWTRCSARSSCSAYATRRTY
ncbi:hypothetical protein EON62_06535 [archaeon]|nr:MAG: hypothetical protein EON62_06535 [archaeon]